MMVMMIKILSSSILKADFQTSKTFFITFNGKFIHNSFIHNSTSWLKLEIVYFQHSEGSTITPKYLMDSFSIGRFNGLLRSWFYQ